jgi:thiol-disulfide isomerase/thioredoxin
MKYINPIVLFVLMNLLHLSAYAEQVTKSQVATAQQQILENTSITTTDGEIIEVKRTKNGLIFKGYENKIVLLEAFGHSCPPCKASIPGYNRLQKKYHKDIVVIAIEVWGSDNAGLKQYANAHGVQYKVVAKAHSGKMVSFIGNLTGWNLNMGVPYLLLFSRGGVLAKDVPPQGLPEVHVDNLIKGLL